MIFWATFILITVLIVLVLGIVVFNRLVGLRNDVKNAWHQIDVQLKRRYDLIPNLVAVVKGAMLHERTTLERVVKARADAISTTGMKKKAFAEDELSSAVGNLLVIIENYPQIKANRNALQLQEELVSAENRIAFARQLYNDLVAQYTTRCEVFPDNLIASMFSFSGFEYFKADDADRIAHRSAISDSNG